MSENDEDESYHHLERLLPVSTTSSISSADYAVLTTSGSRSSTPKSPHEDTNPLLKDDTDSLLKDDNDSLSKDDDDSLSKDDNDSLLKDDNDSLLKDGSDSLIKDDNSLPIIKDDKTTAIADDLALGQIKPTTVTFDCYKWLLNERDRKGGEAAAGSTDSAISSATSSDSSVAPLPVPKAPDGGWGWMVVLGSFLVVVICDGVAYCFGILYSELLEQFGASRSMTSLVGSIFFGVSMILGPFASAMTTRFGCRKVTIAGGLLSCMGFLLSSFATSIEMLCFTFSVIVGTGFSFCYVTSVVIVHFYFDKRRSLATGLSVCGTGVGTFTFAPLLEYLISEYGCRGMFVILAGISLNLVVCGMLFRPLKFTDEERWNFFYAEFDKLPSGRESLELGRIRNTSECSEFSTDLDVLDEEPRTMSMLSLPTFACGEAATTNESSEILMEALKNSKNRHLTYHRYMKNAFFRCDSQESKDGPGEEAKPPLPRDTTVTISVDSEHLSSTCSVTLPSDGSQQNSKNNLLMVPPRDANNIRDSSHSSREYLFGNSKFLTEKGLASVNGELRKSSSSFISLGKEMRSRSFSRLVSGMHVGRHSAMRIQLLLYRTDIFFRDQTRRQAPLSNPCVLGTSCPELTEAGASPQDEWKGARRSVREFLTGILDLLLGTIDLRLFGNLFFTVFVISNFMFYFWNDVPYMFAIDNAVDAGVEANRASFLISIIGIFNTIGQVLFGAVGDTKVNLVVVYAVVLSVSGVFVAAIPFMATYWSMAAAYSLFGFFVSVTFPFSTVLLVNYLGVEQLTSAYGLLMLMQGLANILGPPFAGWMSDKTGSYYLAFVVSGLFYAISGLVMFVVCLPWCRVKPIAANNNPSAEDSNNKVDL